MMKKPKKPHGIDRVTTAQQTIIYNIRRCIVKLAEARFLVLDPSILPEYHYWMVVGGTLNEADWRLRHAVDEIRKTYPVQLALIAPKPQAIETEVLADTLRDFGQRLGRLVTETKDPQNARSVVRSLADPSLAFATCSEIQQIICMTGIRCAMRHHHDHSFCLPDRSY